MLSISPLDYLIAYAIAFLLGVLWTVCFGFYADRIRQEALAHA